MVRKLEAVFKIVTPLFMSGADQSKAELRVPSVKGALRFWYRAITWGKVSSVNDLWRKEAQLFGTNPGLGRDDVGSSRVLMSIEPERLPSWSPSNTSSPGVNYLGYGVLNSKGQPTRGAFQPDSTFRLRMLFDSSCSAEDIDDVARAIKALAFFGGLGARVRRGFGSLSLEQLVLDEQQIWNSPVNVNQLKSTLEGFLSKLKLKADLPPYTAFSRLSRVIIFPWNGKPWHILGRIGKELMSYRKEKAFAQDSQIIKKVTKDHNIEGHPKRVVFGLPHNYFFKNTPQKVNVVADEYERRASPLFISITKLGRASAATLTLLPSQFLPEGTNILIKSDHREHCVPCYVNYEIIARFLDSLNNKVEVRLP